MQIFKKEVIVVLTVLLSPWYSSMSMTEGEPGVYSSLGLGTSGSSSTTFRDVNSDSVSPAALFGSDDTTANGDFGDSYVFEGTVGYKFTPMLRAEVAYGYMPGLEFQGNARFFGVGERQPVSADLTSQYFFINTYLDFPEIELSETLRLQPYLGAGFGKSRNKVGKVNYSFPELDMGAGGEYAVSITPAGSTTENAYQFIAGLSYPIDKRFSLDLQYRYANLGDVTTDIGPLRVVRYNDDGSLNRDTDVQINKTVSQLEIHSWQISLRYFW